MFKQFYIEKNSWKLFSISQKKSNLKNSKAKKVETIEIPPSYFLHCKSQKRNNQWKRINVKNNGGNSLFKPKYQKLIICPNCIKWKTDWSGDSENNLSHLTLDSKKGK